MSREWLSVIALSTILGGFLAPCLSAQQNSASPEEFQVLSLSAGGDSQPLLISQIALAHNCAFWDSVTPRP
jgi:hypothetical protein